MSEVHHLPIVAERESQPSTENASASQAATLRVGDLARACNKTVRAIHHYEKVGLLTPQRRSSGGYRLYGSDAITRVKWIGKLHDLGMGLTEIKQILSAWEKAGSATEGMATIESVYRQKLEEVRMQVARLHSLEKELETSLNFLDTCTTCNPNEPIESCQSCTVHSTEHAKPELVSGLYAGRDRAANS